MTNMTLAVDEESWTLGVSDDGRVITDEPLEVATAALQNEVDPEFTHTCKGCQDAMPKRTTNGFCRFCEQVVLKAVLRRVSRTGFHVRL